VIETRNRIKMPYGPSFLSLFWGIPFAGILTSLAFLPYLAPQIWQKWHKGIIAGWIFAFILPVVYTEGWDSALSVTLFSLTHHYFPFMAVITVLFTVGGGIHITMKGKASPIMNTGFLAVGAFLANIIGTMGASMLLIRPLIVLNKYRRTNAHVVIFFIFLVSNIGGCLTPLGDPPLFIGYLNNIKFFWTTIHLFLPLLFVGCILLTLFWILDHYYFFHDPNIKDPDHLHTEAKFRIEGKRNFIFLSAALCLIVFENIFKSFSYPLLMNIIRDFLLLFIAYLSWKMTPKGIHDSNQFSWKPLEEVAVIFIGIFITVTPILRMLKGGESGAFAPLFDFVNSNGSPNALAYFWATGIFSSILDNAPSYLIFFNLTGGNPLSLMNENADLLIAISTGSVFMGAMTYIGNAPNLVVQSIAMRSHIKMPGFFGYLLWSMGILLPVLLGFSWLWFS